MTFLQYYRKIFGLIFFFSAILYPVASALEVSGDVSGVWGPEDNPYNVVGDLRVPPESSLWIQPGCQINFMGQYRFFVDSLATFHAIGTETDSIIFSSQDTAIGWRGLRFKEAGCCSLAYCVVEHGRASDSSSNPEINGGGMYCSKSNLWLGHSLIKNNRAGEGMGGGIYGVLSYLTISDCVLDSNLCGKGGAAIYCYLCTLYVFGSLIDYNTTYYPLGGEWGGGLSLVYTNATVSNNTICHNFSGLIGGGVLLSGDSHVNFLGNVIAYNGASGAGPGVYIVYGCNISFNNCIFCSNFLSWGPYTAYSNLTSLNSHVSIRGCTFFNGSADFAISTPPYCGYDTVINSIFWGNNGPSIYCEQETLTVRYSDIEGGWPGEGNIDAYPLFIDTAGGNFHLSWANWPFNDSSKSPCIDAGDPASPHDSDGTRADMGAFYFDQRGGGVDDLPLIPQTYRLMQNYPNPFNSSTTIRYHLIVASLVTIDIYDILGRKVATLAKMKQQAGAHQVIWDATGFSSGVYFYRLQAGDKSYSRQMTVIK